MSDMDNGKIGDYISPVALTAARILSERANIGWTTTLHTSTVIPLSATGVEAQRFSGWMDNTQVALVMADLMGFEF
jgi:alkaline phosphatase